MANFVANAERVLSFGESGRDRLSYEVQLQMLKSKGLSREDYNDLASMGQRGISLLNKFLVEVHRAESR